METKEPEILHCRKGEKEIYDRLSKDEDIFKKKDLKHIFLLSAVIGFIEGRRNPIDKREPGGLIRFSYLDEEDKGLLKSIAVVTYKKLDILVDKKSVYSLAEEYASGGLKILEREVFEGEFGSYKKRLGAKLMDEINKNLGKDE
jgi:hypothetical protein